MEIERKFWIDGFPTDLPEIVHMETDQGYLATFPVTLRIRRSERKDNGAVRYVLCIKSKGTLSRHEVETDITKEQYEELESMLEKPAVHKDYHAYRLPDGHTLECSVVDYGAFAYAEVEFQSEEEANAWEPIPFLGEELTYLRGFSMGEYWATRKVPEH